MFAYCNNNPVNLADPSGYCSDWIKEQWEKIKKDAEEVWDKVTDTAYDAYYSLTEWHFEGREQKNGSHPTYEEVSAPGSGWTLLSPEMSIYHDNHIGKPEEKFIHPDGREAVFDGDTHLPITDPDLIATYNYVVPYTIPEDACVCDYILFAYYGSGHFFTDMLPYYATSCSNTREQFENKILDIFR